MSKDSSRLASILDRLAAFYGEPGPPHLTDPYEILVFNYCGYPASDASCAKGFEALKREIGIRPEDILSAPVSKLAPLLRLGGMIPEGRAERLKELACVVKEEFNGDLNGALRGDLKEARKILKRFHSIGDPGADKILLLSGIAPIAAVPSNCVRTPLRLGFGEEKKSYSSSYRSAQNAISAELGADMRRLTRAYLLLKRHGQEVCKETPRCERCPVTDLCVYYRATNE